MASKRGETNRHSLCRQSLDPRDGAENAAPAVADTKNPDEITGRARVRAQMHRRAMDYSVNRPSNTQRSCAVTAEPSCSDGDAVGRERSSANDVHATFAQNSPPIRFGDVRLGIFASGGRGGAGATLHGHDGRDEFGGAWLTFRSQQLAGCPASRRDSAGVASVATGGNSALCTSVLGAGQTQRAAVTDCDGTITTASETMALVAARCVLLQILSRLL